MANSPQSMICADGIRWLLAPGLDQPLFDNAGLRLTHWLKHGQAHVVKAGPHRIVYRVELPGLSFFLKHNRVNDTQTWLRQLVRASKARIEYDSALEVAARGVPTVSPLALGEQSALAGGESYLITRGLEGCEPLNSLLAYTLPRLTPGRRTRVRQRLAEELGRFVARIHDAGILHNDFHAGNILARLDTDDRVSLYLIDLNAMHIGAPLNWATSLDNLVMLNSWFILRVNRPDRLRFWKAYYLARRLGAWGRGPVVCKRHLYLAADVELRTWKFNLAFWKRRDLRCLKNNRYYGRVASGSVVGHAVTELDHASLAPLLANPDEPFTRPGIRLLKDSPSSSVAEFEMVVDGQPRSVIYKRFRATRLLDPLASLFRRTPAQRSWMHGQGFRERALPTARTLAVLHRTRCGMYADGYLLTEKLEDAEVLHVYLDELQSLPAEQRLNLTRSQIDRVARVIRDLHQRQLSHRDLKAANILVRRWDAPVRTLPSSSSNAHAGLLHMPEASVWLIDLVGVELFSSLPRSRKVQNLARLNASFLAKRYVTRTDRLRFLRTYLGWDLVGQGNWKVWWRRIEAATHEKMARNRRRGRPLE